MAEVRLIDANALIDILDVMISNAILADTEIHYALIRELVAAQPTIIQKELIEKIEELQKDNEQLRRDLKAYRSFYPMKNEVCGICMFADECFDENRVEGKRFCSSFHAKLESEE